MQQGIIFFNACINNKYQYTMYYDFTVENKPTSHYKWIKTKKVVLSYHGCKFESCQSK